MPPHAAIGVDNDLAPGQSRITMGATDYETPGRIDMNLGVLIQELRWNHRLDDMLHQVLADLLVGGFLIVLSRKHDGLHADRFAIFIFHGHLGLAIGTEVRKHAVLADLAQLFGQTVSQVNGHRHEGWGFPAGIPEHHSLVARALFVVIKLIDTLSDVGRLRINRHQHRAGLPIESHCAVGVPDALDRAARYLLEIHITLGRDLPGDYSHAGGYQGLASNSSHFVLGEHGIED